MRMKATIIVSLFALVACGQVELSTTTPGSPRTPAISSPAIASLINQWTDPPQNVISATKRVFDSLEARGDLENFYYLQLFNLADTTNNAYVNVMGTTPLATVTRGTVNNKTMEAYVGYKGAFDRNFNTHFNPTDQGVSQDDIIYGLFAIEASSTSDDTNIIFGIDAATDVWIEDERSSLQMSGKVHANGQFGSGDSLLVYNLYSVRRDGAASWDIMDGGTSILSRTESSSGIPDDDMYFGGVHAGGGSVLQEWVGKASMFFIAKSSIDLQGLEDDIKTMNAVIKYSPEAQEMIINTGYDQDTISWVLDIYSWFADTLQTTSQLHTLKYLLHAGDLTETPALTDLIGGVVATKEGSPTFLQSEGWKLDTADAINTNFALARDPENVTIGWKGKVFSNIDTENTLWGNDSVWMQFDSDANNWHSKFYTSNQFGNIFPPDTLKSVVVQKIYSNQVKLWKGDSLAQDITKTHTGLLDTAPFKVGEYRGGDRSIQTLQWLYIGTAQTDPTLMDIILNRFDELFEAQTPPVGGGEDVTNPAPTPVIAFDSKTSTTITVNVTTPSTDESGIDHINVYHDLSGTPATTLGGGATQYIRTGLSASTEYDIELEWVDPSGNKGPKSNIITQTTNASGGALAITIDFESDPGNPPLRVTGPGTIAGRTVVDPTDGGNTVSEHEIDLPTCCDPTSTYDASAGWDARREYEYKPGIADSPPRYLELNQPYGIRFKIYFPTDHIGGHGADDARWANFQQLHQAQAAPQTGGPPLLLQTQDLDDDNIHDVRIKVKYNETIDNNTNIQTTLVAARDVFAENTWYFCVMDVNSDWSNSGTGALRFYATTGGWPNSGDLILSYDGGLGYNNTINVANGGAVYPQWGIYWADTRSVSKVEDMFAEGTTKKHWYIDDWTYQEGHFIYSP